MTEYIEYIEEEYFEELYELDTNSPEYSIVQGNLVEELMEGEDYRSARVEVMDVARSLNNGDIDEAFELTEDLLEED